MAVLSRRFVTRQDKILQYVHLVLEIFRRRGGA
jgi:hypothetical protein